MKDHAVQRTEPDTEASTPVVAQGFGQFYKCPKFSDVSLLDASGHRIAAHRLVLSAGSKKFHELLSRDPSAEIYCIDIEPACLHSMLEYLYTNHCNIQMCNAVQLLAAAVLYGCDELESMASLFIHMQLNANTCCYFFAEAQKYTVEHIAIKSLYVASLDFQNVICSESFYNLSLENLTAMLGSPKLAAISNVALYKAGCDWLFKDRARLVNFKDVFVCVQSRPASATDELHLLRFLNMPEGRGMRSCDPSEESEWTSAAATMTMPPAMPFDSKCSEEAQQLLHAVSQSSQRLPLMDLSSASPFLKDTKSEDRDASTDATSVTTALSGSLFADHVQKNEPQTKSLEAVDSVKARLSEDIASSDTSSVRKPKPKRGRGRKGAGKAGQPFTCQVEGCTANLQGLKEYHMRYKICQNHLKVSSIVKDGHHQRFCQQCGRFHLLEEFDNIKRSCRTRLHRHNLRRRKRLNNTAKAVKQPEGFVPVCAGYPPQHLVYFPTAREADGHATNVDKLYRDGRPRCLQILSPADINPCLMFSPVPRSIDRDPAPQTNHEKQPTATDDNAHTTHRPSYVKQDPGTGRTGDANGN